MTAKFTQCPGCGHHYGRIMSSTPNEHGYCHWCREEGIFDDASAKANDEKWVRYHAEQARHQEEAFRRHLEDECEANSFVLGPWGGY